MSDEIKGKIFALCENSLARDGVVCWFPYSDYHLALGAGQWIQVLSLSSQIYRSALSYGSTKEKWYDLKLKILTAGLGYRWTQQLTLQESLPAVLETQLHSGAQGDSCGSPRTHPMNLALALCRSAPPCILLIFSVNCGRKNKLSRGSTECHGKGSKLVFYPLAGKPHVGKAVIYLWGFSSWQPPKGLGVT